MQTQNLDQTMSKVCDTAITNNHGGTNSSTQ